MQGFRIKAIRHGAELTKDLEGAEFPKLGVDARDDRAIIARRRSIMADPVLRRMERNQSQIEGIDTVGRLEDTAAAGREAGEDLGAAPALVSQASKHPFGKTLPAHRRRHRSEGPVLDRPRPAGLCRRLAAGEMGRRLHLERQAPGRLTENSFAPHSMRMLRLAINSVMQ